ncbi:MAG: hypothetical protein GTO40_09305, partial [Deltaproteobacteria bacterium]|nr:hypothetical protein [Deltaproteobacteria bacterium]
MDRKEKRGKRGVVVSLMILALLLAFGGTTAQAADEIRIGFLAPMTGPLAKPGEDLINGF